MSRSPSRHSESESGPKLVTYIAIGLSWGMLALVCLVAIAVIVVPAVTGSSTYSILTGSMKPTLPPGTLVVVRPTDIADIHIGSVVTYQLESGKPEVVTHRVVGIVQPNLPGGTVSFITKGDANPSPDVNPVIPTQVRGTVWYAIPLIGRINVAFGGSQRDILVVIAAVALLLYGGYQLFSSGRDRRRARQADAPELADADADADADLATSGPSKASE